MPLQRFLLYFFALIVVCFSALPHALPTPEAASQAAQDRIAASVADTGGIDTAAQAPDILATVRSYVPWRLALQRRQPTRQRLSGFATLQGDLPSDLSSPSALILSIKTTPSAGTV